MQVVKLFPKSEPEPVRSKSASSLPEGFDLTPALRNWAREKGITRIEDRMEHFKDLCLAKGYKYLSFEAAFRNSCRQDWARFGGSAQQSAVELCAGCHNPLHGFTLTRKGKLCSNCWGSR